MFLLEPTQGFFYYTAISLRLERLLGMTVFNAVRDSPSVRKSDLFPIHK